MYKTTEIILERELEIVTEVTCNQCGTTVYKHNPPLKMTFEETYVDQPQSISDNGIHVEVCCESENNASKFNCGDQFDFYLCENCLYDLVHSFAIKPKVINLLKGE